MELSDAMCSYFKETADAFHGAQRRRYMAETVETFGLSQRQAEHRLGWAHDTVRKALHELHSGITCVDNFSARGRKPAEFHCGRPERPFTQAQHSERQRKPKHDPKGLLGKNACRQQTGTGSGYPLQIRCGRQPNEPR